MKPIKLNDKIRYKQHKRGRLGGARELVEQAAVKMSARKKAIGNAKESTVAYPHLLQSLDYEDTIEIH